MMNEQMNSHSWNGFILGTVVGAVIGAGVALLVAPYSGQETRHRLAEGTRHIKDKVGSAFDKAREAVHREA